MEKAFQYYVTRYLTVWELDIIRPPGVNKGLRTHTTGPKGRQQERLIAAARDKVDFLFSLLPLASLKSGYHPAPGSCSWIYALVVQQYLSSEHFKPNADYEQYYRRLAGPQQQLERAQFIEFLRSISEKRIERLIQTGPAPYWIGKPLFPTPPASHVTKETCAPAKIWKVDSLHPLIKTTDLKTSTF